jgi:hypothetical protein
VACARCWGDAAVRRCKQSSFPTIIISNIIDYNYRQYPRSVYLQLAAFGFAAGFWGSFSSPLFVLLYLVSSHLSAMATKTLEARFEHLSVNDENDSYAAGKTLGKAKVMLDSRFG